MLPFFIKATYSRMYKNWNLINSKYIDVYKCVCKYMYVSLKNGQIICIYIYVYAHIYALTYWFIYSSYLVYYLGTLENWYNSYFLLL